MSSFKEKFDGLLLEFIKRRGVNANKVTGYNETARSYQSGCETCGDYETDFEVEIYYEDDSPYRYTSYTYDGSFAELINTLAEIDEELNRPERCPTCDSHSPNLHPAIQSEGEVQPCRDDWHSTR